jgi:hypothetical protein
MVGHRSRHQKHIGIPGRGSEKKTQTMHIVIRFVELLDFAQTSAAGTGINHPEVKRTLKRSPEFVLPLSAGARRNGPFIISLPLPLQGRREPAETAITMDAALLMKYHLPILSTQGPAGATRGHRLSLFGDSPGSWQAGRETRRHSGGRLLPGRVTRGHDSSTNAFPNPFPHS